MGMSDEPYDILRPRRTPTAPTTLTLEEAFRKFGTLKGQTRDSLFECYSEFPTHEGLWKPQFDSLTQRTVYRLFPRKEAR
jgi:hypothetical protein